MDFEDFEDVEDLEDVEDVDESIIPSFQAEVEEGLWRLEVPAAEVQEVGPEGPSPVSTFREIVRKTLEAKD